MTNDDILRAAFRVWGRDFYRTTSLNTIALELGVSKTALYRHFKDKDALLDAMYAAYMDDCAGFLKNGYDKAIKAEDNREAFRIWTLAIAEYFVRNRDALIFSLIKVYNSHDTKSFYNEFRSRGIDFMHPVFLKKHAAVYPSRMQLSMATLIFCVTHFHHDGGELPDVPEEEVKRILSEIDGLVSKGLGLDAERVAELDFMDLEQRAASTLIEETEDNALLRAVAGAVAEAGPWEASMEMVARRSGLSKSGLYAHFKSKQDMLTQLFITELTRIIKFAKIHIETSEVSEEQLYLAIISIVNYLRSRPEILIALDWIKTGRLDLEKEMLGHFYRIIGEIRQEAIQSHNRHLLVWAAQWILFMIVNTLALWQENKNPQAKGPGKQNRDTSWARNAAEIPNESFRALFRFIALGSEGLNDL